MIVRKRSNLLSRSSKVIHPLTYHAISVTLWSSFGMVYKFTYVSLHRRFSPFRDLASSRFRLEVSLRSATLLQLSTQTSSLLSVLTSSIHLFLSLATNRRPCIDPLSVLLRVLLLFIQFTWPFQRNLCNLAKFDIVGCL